MFSCTVQVHPEWPAVLAPERVQQPLLIQAPTLRQSLQGAVASFAFAAGNAAIQCSKMCSPACVDRALARWASGKLRLPGRSHERTLIDADVAQRRSAEWCDALPIGGFGHWAKTLSDAVLLGRSPAF